MSPRRARPTKRPAPPTAKRTPKRGPPKRHPAAWHQPSKARRQVAAKNGQVTVAAKKLVQRAERGQYGSSLMAAGTTIEDLRAQARAECARPLSGPIGDAKVGLYPTYVVPDSQAGDDYAEAIATAVERAEDRAVERGLGPSRLDKYRR